MDTVTEKYDLEQDKEGVSAPAAHAASNAQRPVASLTMAVVKRGSNRVTLERPPEIEAVRPGGAFAPPSATEPAAAELAELASLTAQQPELNDPSAASEFTEPPESEKSKAGDGIDAASDLVGQERDVIKSIRRDSAETELDFSEEPEDHLAEQSRRSRLASLTWREVGFFSVLYVFALLLFGSLFDFWSVLGLH